MKLKCAWICTVLGTALVVSQANGQSNTFPASGNVGIGTANPNTILHVVQSGSPIIEIQSPDSGTPGITWVNPAGFYANQLDGGNLYWWNGGDRKMTLSSNGNLGIGTAAPWQKLSVANGSLALDNYAFLSSMRNGLNNYTNAFFGGALVDNGNGTYTVGTDGGSNYFAAMRMDNQGGNAGAINFYTGATTGGTSYSLSNALLGTYQRMTIVGSNVGIGTGTPGARLEINGNLKFSSDAGAAITFSDATVQSTAWTGVLSGGDYAESVDVAAGRDSIGPGDLVVIDPERNGQFLKSTRAYSTLIGGVYATKPGVVGRRQPKDKSSAGEVPMAMIGIVPTKVSTENGPIHRGDLLVSATTPGYAMKGTDHNRMMGAVIGKALASMEAGSGVIEVLISLQ